MKIYSTNILEKPVIRSYPGMYPLLKKACLALLGTFLFVSGSWAQTKKVTGKVTDSNTGEALSGVTVTIEGTYTTTTADNTGTYTIEVPAKAALLFSHVGYPVQRIKVGNSSHIDISLV
ncbi:MAG: carboxypeptidase-like regulatory domain-containing protein, partial [Ginsengibacter sp.]